MPSIAPAASLEIIEPEEFDPIELLRIAKQQFLAKGIRLSTYEYSIVFGTEYQQISRWKRGVVSPPRLARIRAASLMKDWGLIGNSL